MVIQLDQPAQRLWLLFLFTLWAVLLFGGFLLGKPAADGKRRMPRWTRLSSSAVLVLAGWSWVLFLRASPVALYALLIALGMTVCFFGDLFLAGKLLRSGGKVAGIASFALGHILYIAAIIWLARFLGLPTWAAMGRPLLLWWLFAAAGWYLIVYRGAAVTTMHWLVLPYALLLATTAGAASALALQEPAFWPLALGAGLFLISDMILGGEWFGDLHLPLVHDIIWMTYGPGQMLIVASIGIASAL